MIQRLKQFVGDYGLMEQHGFVNFILTWLVSRITGYNHKKYWKRRSYVIDVHKKNVFKKLYYIFYLKRVDAKHLSSSGFSYNIGAQFITPPNLPHGLNRIIVGHDAHIGANVTIYQGVTISQGKCFIGNNVILGANCVILPNVHVSDNAKIGANCVVVEDVPNGATCVMQKPRILFK